LSESVDYPKSWFFHSDNGDADGPVFRGRFTGVIEEGQSAYGPKPVARFVEEASGEERSIWLMNQSLQDQLIKLRPEKDELVEITYLGKKKSKTSKFSYQSFKAVAPERPQVALTWDALGTVDVEEEDDE
jgi:hypothetical protein